MTPTPDGAPVLLDPTSELVAAQRRTAARLSSLEGSSIGLLDISKARGDVYLDRIQEHLEDRGARVLRFTKPTFSKIAPPDLRAEIAERCDAVIEALAD